MNKIKLLFMAIAASVLLNANVYAAAPYTLSEKKLEYGFVQIYDFGTVKLHAYQTADAMTDECFVLETNTNLVGIESPAFTNNFAEWKQYVASLNKPLTDIFISYHPAGGKWYGSARSHATETARKAISAGATKNLAESLSKTFGPSFSTDIPPIDSIIKSGPNTVGGLDFEITEDGDGYDIAIPDINVIYLHMLGADNHSILAGNEYIETYLASLEDMRGKGYSLILSGHHTPENQADLAAKIAYVKKVRELATQSKDKNDFKERVKAQFPDYHGLNYLDMTADFLFDK